MDSMIQPAACEPPPLAVLPRRRRCERVLDAAGALELAVLGATACRLTPLPRLVETVWCLTGDGWRPPREVVYATLQAATRRGLVIETESWVRSVPFHYTLTPEGAVDFRALMRLPLPAHDDPVSRASAAVKLGLLDMTDLCDTVPVAADLRRFYLDCRAGLEERRRALPADRPLLQRALDDRLAWIDSRIRAVDEVCTV